MSDESFESFANGLKSTYEAKIEAMQEQFALTGINAEIVVLRKL